ncbi:MAG: hypothetical protein AAF598_04100 [Bacteroidota bacterium]
MLPIFWKHWIPLGYEALISGWMGVVGPYYYFVAWLANIFFGLSLLCFTADAQIALVLSALSVCCALFALKMTTIYRIEGNIDNVRVGIGFYVWISSFISFFIANLVR